MAKANVFGQAVVITSSLKMEDLKLVEKYRPKALTLVDPETKECVFRVMTGRNGSIDKNGAIFSDVSKDGSGLATITVYTDSDSTGEALVDEIVESIGSALMKLEQIENALPATVGEITGERDAVKASIQILGMPDAE